MKLSKDDISHLIELIRFDKGSDTDEILEILKAEIENILMQKLVNIVSRMLQNKLKDTYTVTLTMSQKAMLARLCEAYNHPFHHVIISKINE